MPSPFKDQVVVLTGAGSGIGRAAALAYAAEGARLHLLDLVEERLQELRGVLHARDSDATTHVVDLADAAQVQRVAETILGLEGRVDILHNNAGVVGAGPIEQIPLERWQWALGANLWSVIHTVSAFVPQMIAQRSGHIVNTASMAGLIGLPRCGPYCASKFAVVGLSEALDAELAVHGIHVMLVCPGTVKTNIMRDGQLELPARARGIIDQMVSFFGASPERVAQAVLSGLRRKKRLVVLGPEMIPLWLLKRASMTGYLGLTRSLTTLALRSLG